MTYEQFWQPLTDIYDPGEAKAVARLVMESRYGLSLTNLLCGKLEAIDEKELKELQQRLLTGEPVQYVLGQAVFGGRLFQVEQGVLIPRPETYELCQLIIEDHAALPPIHGECNILDIGTGSGCIACTLAAEITHGNVTAWDISDEALRIAEANAKRTHVNVSFVKQDALSPPPFSSPLWDVIVSNPPYICRQERAAMSTNVTDFEPELALFVPDDDPLLFYRSIAHYAFEALRAEGSLYFEINPLYVAELKAMLNQTGFLYVESSDDQFGKTRFIKACKQRRK